MNLLTKRFPTILGLLLLLVVVFGGLYYYKNGVAKVPGDIVPQQVRISNISDNKFSVSWTTVATTTGKVEYGPVGDKIAKTAKDDRDGTTSGQYQTHHVTIEGLQPSTQYAFRILSSEKLTKFDNSGTPYAATTGVVIGNIPPSQNFYGNVQLPSKQPVQGALVYITLPGAATASTVVRDGGNYAFTLSTIRSADNQSYVKFDPAATIASLLVVASGQQSIVNVSLANSAPVPAITLGQSEDFLNPGQTPSIAQVDNTQATPAGIFNVEPLAADPAAINSVDTTSVVLLNPKTSGEVLKTLRPEFRGTGPAGTTLSIALTGQKAISDTVSILTDGTWTWTPVIDLKTGKQLITISYTGTTGTKLKIERDFSVSTSTTGLDPAFVSSPSASTKPTKTIAKTATSSATPRTAMPDTSGGTPVTGVIENTLLTAGLGIVIMVVGAALLL